MRIINRVVITKETKDCVETRVTERIVEDEQLMLRPITAGVPESEPDVLKVECDICTYQFDLDGASNRAACPACGSKSVRMA